MNTGRAKLDTVRCMWQGPDGKWNQYTGRYAWDASCIVGNQAAQFGGTGAVKTEDLFEAAPNLDHSSVISPLLAPRSAFKCTPHGCKGAHLGS